MASRLNRRSPSIHCNGTDNTPPPSRYFAAKPQPRNTVTRARSPVTVFLGCGFAAKYREGGGVLSVPLQWMLGLRQHPSTFAILRGEAAAEKYGHARKVARAAGHS